MRAGMALARPASMSDTPLSDKAMIHLFAKHPDPENTRFSDELRRSGLEFRIFGEEINLKFKNRWELLLLGYPRLLKHALKYATISLGRSSPAPDVAVLESDVEALGVLGRPGCDPAADQAGVADIHLHRAPAGRLAALRDRYISFTLNRVDRVICHSRLEVERYRRRFPKAAAKFVVRAVDGAALWLGGRAAAAQRAAEPAAKGAVGGALGARLPAARGSHARDGRRRGHDHLRPSGVARRGRGAAGAAHPAAVLRGGLYARAARVRRRRPAAEGGRHLRRARWC